MAESQATHKLHDINDLAVYVMQSDAKDLRSFSFRAPFKNNCKDPSLRSG